MAIFCCVSLLAWPVTIDKAKVKVSLAKGETYNTSILIHNPTYDEAIVKVYLEDFRYIAPNFDGTKEFAPPGSMDTSISTWCNFSPQEFVIKPFTFQTVNVSITPEEAFDKVHCGVLFFEKSLGADIGEDGKVIEILGRIGTLIFVDPKEGKKQAAFDNIEGDTYKLRGTFKNNGNNYLLVKGTFYVLDAQGMVKDRGQLKELYLLSQDNAYLEIPFSDALTPEETYTSIITFDLGDNDVFVKEIDFSLAASGRITVKEVRD